MAKKPMPKPAAKPGTKKPLPFAPRPQDAKPAVKPGAAQSAKAGGLPPAMLAAMAAKKKKS